VTGAAIDTCCSTKSPLPTTIQLNLEIHKFSFSTFKFLQLGTGTAISHCTYLLWIHRSLTCYVYINFRILMARLFPQSKQLSENLVPMLTIYIIQVQKGS